MATVIDLKVKVGNDISSGKYCPNIIATSTPVFTWTLPENITQKRYNIKIENIDNGDGLFILGEVSSSDNFFEYPKGNPMTDRFLGLCRCEIAISSNTYGNFEYTSGYFYFVYDDVVEIMYNRDSVTLQWDNSYDPDGQSLSYHIQVSTNPLFNQEDIIVDEDVNGNSSSQKTSKIINIQNEMTYYWRVKSFDGMDYSIYSKVNGFINSANSPPVLIINSVYVTNNQYKDVIINFTITDIDDEEFQINCYYIGGNAFSKSRMSLLNPIVIMNMGEHSITWRSSRDEKLVEGEYLITLEVIDNSGFTDSKDFGYFHMDNSTSGEDSGGIGAIDISFPSFLNIGKKIENSISIPQIPLKLNLRDEKNLMNEKCFALKGDFSTFSSFYNGNLENGFSSYSYWDSYGLKNIFYPQGVKFGSNKTDISGTDLDTMDDNLVITTHYVLENGRYPKLTNREINMDNNRRYGFVRFIKHIISDKNLCLLCGGKGWNINELYNDGNNFHRTPCSLCKGTRFSDIFKDLIGHKSYKYIISDYKILEDFFAPNDVDSNNFFRLDISSFESRKKFFYGPYCKSIEYRGSDSFLQKDAETIVNDKYNIKGIYPFFGGSISFGKKIIGDSEITFPIKMKPFPEYILDKYHISPVIEDTAPEKSNYVPGYGSWENDFFSDRDQPTNRWERGMWVIKTNIGKKEILEPLKIIYLQNGWDSYNTIHWQSTMSRTTRIHLQICKFFEDGSHTEYVDVMSEMSEYNISIDGYLVQPNSWHTFWDSTKQEILDSGYDYRLRIRQFDIVSKTSSQWIYSVKFYISKGIPNPANIISTEYDKWTKQLKINYRIDSSNNDYYELLKMWYSVDGNVFHEIYEDAIYGIKKELSSNRENDENLHSIIWDTSSYDLIAGNDYRVKMEVIPSKFVDGLTYPVLSWSKENNPERSISDLRITELNGSVQTIIIDEEGNIEKLENPIVNIGEIQEIEQEIDYLKSSPLPLPSGLYSCYEDNILISPSGYQIWMNTVLGNGMTKGDLLLSMSDDLNNKRDVELPYHIEKIKETEKAVRRGLIDQGFYCNGYNNNNVEDGRFMFMVISNASDSDSFINGEFSIIYKERYEVYNRVQIDFFNTFDSQNGKPLRDFMYDSFGNKIQGSNEYSSSFTTSDGSFSDIQVNNNRWDSVDASGEISNMNVAQGVDSSIGSSSRRVFSQFIIQKEDLPGEWINHKIDNTYSVTDIIPDGIESFSYSYKWRVASYNIVKSAPLEKPNAIIDSITKDSNNLKISFKVFGDIGIQNVSVFSIECASENIGEWEEDSVSFPTDVPDGIENSSGNNMSWVPYGEERIRPAVIIEENNYYMWYTKSNFYKENSIVHARGKDSLTFGEYDVSIPHGDNSLYGMGFYAVYSPSVAKIGDIWHLWYTGYKNEEGNAIYHSISSNAWEWSNPEKILGVNNGSYNPSVIYNNNEFIIYYCALYNGTSSIRRAVSVDGVNFTNDSLYEHRENDLNTPCVFLKNNNEIVFCTEISSTSKIICLNDSYSDIENAENPYILNDIINGKEVIRIYYNKKVDNIWKIKTSVWNDINWNNIISSGLDYVVTGDLENISSSVYGSPLHEININLNDGRVYEWFRNKTDFSIDDIRILLINDLSEREYLIQSEWLSSSNKEATNSEMNPILLKYDPIVKEIDYWRLL
ncbi:MAG: hypothetical protein M0P71_01335 [Melioribacteraceae bacterium]|nr:hypothetical protein [Melioribacteraceae bacterium]